VAVINTFEPTPVKIVAKATKTLDGKAPGKSVFEFALVGTSENAADISLSAKNDAAGAVEFEAFTLWKVGTYEFDLYEVAGSDTSIVYDNTVHHVVVTVEIDEAGTPVATTSYDGGNAAPVFANTTDEPGPGPEPDPGPGPEPDPGPGPTPDPGPTPARALPVTGDVAGGIEVTVLVGSLCCLVGTVLARRARRG
jgi:pilin isopeptide linkage protein